MTDPKAQAAAEGGQEEMTLLDSLLAKVNLEAPKEGKQVSSIEEADQNERLSTKRAARWRSSTRTRSTRSSSIWMKS